MNGSLSGGRIRDDRIGEVNRAAVGQRTRSLGSVSCRVNVRPSVFDVYNGNVRRSIIRTARTTENHHRRFHNTSEIIFYLLAIKKIIVFTKPCET